MTSFLDPTVANSATESSDSTPSAATSDSTKAVVAFLPSKIANAIVRVYEDLPGLTHTQRQVLACLMRFGVKKDRADDAIYVKKITIARHLGVSEATIYRCLAALERASWIERLERLQSMATLKVIGKIRLSRRAIFALGLDAVSGRQACADSANEANVDLASMRDVNPRAIQSSLKRQPASGGSFVRIQGKGVPDDLAWLVTENALQLPALFLLMRIAREAKQRLSDVVAAARHALSELRGRSLFCYVRALIQKPIDYSYILARQQAKADAVDTADRARAAAELRLAELLSRLRGRRHVLENGTALEIDEASVVISSARGIRYALPHERSLPWLERFAKRIERLNAGREGVSASTGRSTSVADECLGTGREAPGLRSVCNPEEPLGGWPR